MLHPTVQSCSSSGFFLLALRFHTIAPRAVTVPAKTTKFLFLPVETFSAEAPDEELPLGVESVTEAPPELAASGFGP